MHQEALQRAIDIAGGQSALARLLGKKQGHVWHWLHQVQRLSPEIAIAIERATEGKVSRGELRPDIFGRDAA